MFFILLTLITALSISAVAIYYSVAGLMTIFAGAAIPILIMGSVLEVSKLVTVVWLHRYWNSAVWWLKGYLLLAVVVLMLITSMGVFGFLSKAHIEQAADAISAEETIARLEERAASLNVMIERAQQEIEDAETGSVSRARDLQDQISLEQERIDAAIARLQPEIDRQIAIIERERANSGGLIEEQIAIIDENLTTLEAAIASNNILLIQEIVGVNRDGIMGPGTRSAITAYQSAQENRRLELTAQLAEFRTETNPVIERADAEIVRIRALIEEEISSSNQLINRLRAQLGQDDSEQVAAFVNEQEAIITDARNQIDTIHEERFALQTELRLLEAEVGPVRYIAELIYGDANQVLLEESVRWVILIIIFVFDPLAVLLLIASQYAYDIHRKDSKLKKSYKY